MEAIENNLFLPLHKWARRQDENFCTEVLAWVLKHLLERQPEVAVRLLESLTDRFLVVPPEEALRINVDTQRRNVKGRTDLEIRWADCLVVVEVKVESKLRKGQMKRYRGYLRKSQVPRTLLLLLTRDAPTFDEGDDRP